MQGPASIWIYLKLEGYININSLIEDLQNNFVEKTPIEILESQTSDIGQKKNESVRDYGLRMSYLDHKIRKRITEDQYMQNGEKNDIRQS